MSQDIVKQMGELQVAMFHFHPDEATAAKMQSVLDQFKALDDAAKQHLLPRLAGQVLEAWMKREPEMAPLIQLIFNLGPHPAVLVFAFGPCADAVNACMEPLKGQGGE